MIVKCTARHPVARHLSAKPAFSLLETTIGLGILGIGLVMLAALFPVALTQHRQSVDRAQSLDVVTKAEAMLHNRLNSDQLWFDPFAFNQGFDSPWYLIPFVNINVPGTWDLPAGILYADAINQAPVGFSTVQLVGTDVLSDRIAPATGNEANEAANRQIWYGFYRQMGSGAKTYAAAICKQRRNQTYYRQDLSVTAPFAEPTRGALQRFPVPWRVTVAREPNSRILTTLSTTPAAASLESLTPIGSKIMIHGQTYATVPGVLDFPAGRILSVVETNGNRIRVLQDISDIPQYDIAVDAFRFDIWIFPPARNAENSPLLDWKVSL